MSSCAIAAIVGRLIELMAFLSREYAQASTVEAQALVRVNALQAGGGTAAVMTKKPVRISPDMMAADALSLMQSKDITVLAVTDETGGVLGILHLHDLLGKGEFRFFI